MRYIRKEILIKLKHVFLQLSHKWVRLKFMQATSGRCTCMPVKTKDSFIVLPVYMKFISWAKTLGVIDFISIEVWVSSAKPPVNMAWKYALPADKTARWAWNL